MSRMLKTPVNTGHQGLPRIAFGPVILRIILIFVDPPVAGFIFD
jgi:hypothetical protein